jgi:hypothetical protein
MFNTNSRHYLAIIDEEVLTLVLYTPMPPELIWATEPSETIALQEVEHEGVTLIVQPTGMNTGRIMQIKSTDPYVFLKREYQPGRTISFTADLSLKDDLAGTSGSMPNCM